MFTLCWFRSCKWNRKFHQKCLGEVRFSTSNLPLTLIVFRKWFPSLDLFLRLFVSSFQEISRSEGNCYLSYLRYWFETKIDILKNINLYTPHNNFLNASFCMKPLIGCNSTLASYQESILLISVISLVSNSILFFTIYCKTQHVLIIQLVMSNFVYNN